MGRDCPESDSFPNPSDESIQSRNPLGAEGTEKRFFFFFCKDKKTFYLFTTKTFVT